MTTLPAGQKYSTAALEAVAKCDPQGLIPSICSVLCGTWLIIGRTAQEFSFGGEADSTYEYFIKEHILLGGSQDQYKQLYVQSVEAAQKFLFFKPLVEGDPDILFSGKYQSRLNDNGTADGVLVGEMQHLVHNLRDAADKDLFRGGNAGNGI